MKSQNLILIAMLLVSAGLSVQTRAVVPAPDGGYSGGNTAEGQNALLSLSSGLYNTAVGLLSLRSVTTGNYNTGVGAGTLVANTANENTATGTGALLSNNSGPDNTADGAFALVRNMIGTGNTATGARALLNTTGDSNTANGAFALANNTIGSLNIALGIGAGSNVTTASNVIAIGTDGNNVANSCYIGQIFGATSSGGTPVYINMNGRLGTSTSSRRFKQDIKPMEHASETLFSLKPVTFRYKKGVDPEGADDKSQFGLVAEDVDKVNPDLVVRDKEGKPYSVRYDRVNTMLLNEFLKEHKTVQELKSAIQKQEAIIIQQQKTFQSKLAAQEKRLETLTAGIEKVSAQLELSNSRPQTALNNQ